METDLLLNCFCYFLFPSNTISNSFSRFLFLSQLTFKKRSNHLLFLPCLKILLLKHLMTKGISTYNTFYSSFHSIETPFNAGTVDIDSNSIHEVPANTIQSTGVAINNCYFTPVDTAEIKLMQTRSIRCSY